MFKTTSTMYNFIVWFHNLKKAFNFMTQHELVCVYTRFHLDEIYFLSLLKFDAMLYRSYCGIINENETRNFLVEVA